MFLFGTPLLVASLALIQPIIASTVFIPPNPATGESIGQWKAKAGNFDAPKVQPINGTSYDWWYFDVVSSTPDTATGGLQSLTIVFYTASAHGFTPLAGAAALGYTSIDLVQVVAAYPNGTTTSGWFNGTQATVTSCNDGVRGEFLSDEGKATFKGSADLSSYTVIIDAPEAGMVGTLKLHSIAPPHYAGGEAVEGQNMELAKNIGWANAVPDSTAYAEFVILGENFNVDGYGYHDKNWGLTSFSETVNTWYWGHGRLGEYSVVWFDYLGPNGETSVSGYVSKDNKIIASGPSGIRARPIGANSTYPPLSTTGAPTGFQVDINIPEGMLSFEVISKGIVAGKSGSFYTRSVGWMTGGVNNATNLEGAALYEQFAFGT